jgi:hypothetical protein
MPTTPWAATCHKHAQQVCRCLCLQAAAASQEKLAVTSTLEAVQQELESLRQSVRSTPFHNACGTLALPCKTSAAFAAILVHTCIPGRVFLLGGQFDTQ